MPLFALVCCAASALPLGGGVATSLYNGTVKVQSRNVWATQFHLFGSKLQDWFGGAALVPVDYVISLEAVVQSDPSVYDQLPLMGWKDGWLARLARLVCI